MEYVIVCVVAFAAAAMTLFSGFGLGTLLMPAMALVFPIETAVGATAVVHLANNLFKLWLVGRNADKGVVLRFGIPAIIAAIIGAWLLLMLGDVPTITEYDVGSRRAVITPIKLVMGGLIVLFALIELWPRFKKLEFPPSMLPVGGIVSGFFGGLSGHQGAMRAAFLIRAGLDKEQFVGTAAVCSAIVDITRLIVYFIAAGVMAGKFGDLNRESVPLIVAACVAAFIGSFFGAKLVKKVTLGAIQVFVAVLLAILGVAMIAGII